jgi:hypothetical protein
MALVASITPISILNKQAIYLSAYVLRYDLQAKNCKVRYELLSTGSGLATWGTDDKVIIQSVATDKNLTITGYPTGSL